MVPWVELPKSAQVHHYYFVIRELLEGAYEWDKKNELLVLKFDNSTYTAQQPGLSNLC